MEKLRNSVKQIVAMLVAWALAVVVVPIGAQAAISDWWAEKDVDLRLEPHYESIVYTLDPIATLQRFDAKGLWYWPASTQMDDSKLTLTAATNASLHVSHAPTLDDGMYFEARMKVVATGTNVSMILKEDTGVYNVSIYIGIADNVHGTYTKADKSTAHTANFGAIVAGTWYKLGILFSGTTVTFYAYNDDYTVLGYKIVSDAKMTYADVEEVEFAQTVAAKTANIDYFVQTSVHSDLSPVGQASKALRVATEQVVSKRNVAFTLDELKDVVTLSNDSAVQITIGYAPTGKDLSNDNKLNQTDLAQILMETAESTSAKFTGTTVVKGWDSVRDSVETSIEDYLAGRHSVSRVYLIDYYMDDMVFNVTTTSGMATKVEKTAIKAFISNTKAKGGEINYDDEVGLRKDWTDFDFVYMPRDITSVQWKAIKEDVSNSVRKKCFSMVALTQARPNDVVEPIISLSIAGAFVPFSGDMELGTTFQMTNALIGNILRGNEYAPVNAAILDDQMASVSASGFDTIEDGKATASGMSLVVSFTSILLWVIGISVLCICAVIVVLMLGKRRRRKRGKKR